MTKYIFYLKKFIAFFSDENLGQVLENIVVEHQIPMDAKSVVFVGRDTRTSSQALSKAVTDGVEAVQGAAVVDYGVVSTPQLHYFVVCHNTKGAYGQASIEGYFEKLSKAFVDFRQGVGHDEGDLDKKTIALIPLFISSSAKIDWQL